MRMIAQDKANHFIAGALISVAGAFHSALGAVLAAFVLGCLKEIADGAINYRTTKDFFAGPHTVSGPDIGATTCGALPLFFYLELLWLLN